VLGVAAGDVARWDHPASGTPWRVEHWTNAAEQGAVAAATLLEGDAAPAYDPVPYFWSDQYDRKIQMVGRADPDDEVRVVDGSFDERRFVAAYGREGHLVAAIGFNRPAKVMGLKQAIADGSSFPPGS
jgi:NADPH-dependent 2,4-dienoyl-CoA reductase/sulfur reductase-like enzyme